MGYGKMENEGGWGRMMWTISVEWEEETWKAGVSIMPENKKWCNLV